MGYAVDDEEHAVGLRCIAAPVFDETGDVVGAISVSGPMARIVDGRVAQLGARVRQAARALSADMGAPRTESLVDQCPATSAPDSRSNAT